jgi:phosphoesterase RecJ-like protein
LSQDSIKDLVTFRFPKEEMEKVKELLNSPGEIVITTHHRPDGDAMGSSLGLYNYLIKKGKKVTVITPSEYPDFLNWLPGNFNVLVYANDKEKCDQHLEQAGIIFCLDFNWMNRVEKMAEKLRISGSKKILIDHHLDPEKVYDIAFSYSDACSTCELIFDFIVAMNDSALIDKKIAECLYCGIMTDTNSFRFASMKAGTHRIIAALMEAGAENYKIHERVYDTNHESRMRLLGYALLEKLVVLREFNAAYIVLMTEDLIKYDFKSGDTEGLVNYALSIEGIRLAVFFSELEGQVKISFRSKGDFSVKELSAKYFGGGGHKNASGGFSKDSMEVTVNRFLEILPSYKKHLTDS